MNKKPVKKEISKSSKQSSEDLDLSKLKSIIVHSLISTRSNKLFFKDRPIILTINGKPIVIRQRDLKVKAKETIKPSKSKILNPSKVIPIPSSSAKKFPIDLNQVSNTQEPRQISKGLEDKEQSSPAVIELSSKEQLEEELSNLDKISTNLDTLKQELSDRSDNDDEDEDDINYEQNNTRNQNGVSIDEINSVPSGNAPIINLPVDQKKDIDNVIDNQEKTRFINPGEVNTQGVEISKESVFNTTEDAFRTTDIRQSLRDPLNDSNDIGLEPFGPVNPDDVSFKGNPLLPTDIVNDQDLFSEKSSLRERFNSVSQEILNLDNIVREQENISENFGKQFESPPVTGSLSVSVQEIEDLRRSNQ